MSCETTDSNLMQGVLDQINGNPVSKIMGTKFSLEGKLEKLNIPEPKQPTPNIRIRTGQDAVIKSVAQELFEIEANMPQGGSKIITYLNDLYVTVGGVPVGADVAPPIRVIDCNKPQLTDISIEADGTKPTVTFTPYTEPVNNSAVPFGTYIVTAQNQHVLMVGAGGITINTEGNYSLRAAGSINIDSLHELNLHASKGNMSITGNHNILISGDSVCIETKDINKKVIINSSLGVARNVVVHGSAYIEGELYVQHLTCPQEIHDSGESGYTKGQLAADTIIGYVDLSMLISALAYVPGFYWSQPTAFPVRTFMAFEGPVVPGIPVASGVNKDVVDIYPHTHPYKTIASSLADSNSLIRRTAKDTFNSGVAGVARAQKIGGDAGQSITD